MVSGEGYQGRIQEFLKGEGGKGTKPRTERRRCERRRGSGGPPPENLEKLDAISCNLAYIFGIRMASDIMQNWASAEQKTVAATISIHTHTHTPHTSNNSSDLGHYKIQIQFQKYFFRHCIQCKKIKLTLPKIGGSGPLPPWIRHWLRLRLFW